jgi:transglutaminase-like putative cysteine protease
MKLRIVHRSTYGYSEAVTTSHHDARLAPRPSENQRTLSHEVDIEPAPAAQRRRFDYFGNRTIHFSLSEAHRSLDVSATSVVDLTAARVPSDPTPAWELVREQLRTDRRRDVLDAYQMTLESRYAKPLPELYEYGEASFVAGRPILDAARDLMRRIHDDFAYDTHATDISTPLATVYAQRRGVCQDFAHLMVGCLRARGLAGRYVSGYLLTRPPPGKVKLVGADVSHAWAATWLPEGGWVDFDPTNDVVPSSEHVTLAYGRDYADVTPIRGVIVGGGRHSLRVSVHVEPLAEED